VINRVVVTARAAKDLTRIPVQITRKLRGWASAVETFGLEEVRKVPGYHDEPLKGDRAGQRSIRLNRAYRAIYVIGRDGAVEFVSVEEVNKHDY
jgi:proteic killer suppression protein